MPITLYGRHLSSATRRAALILNEKNVPFTLREVPFATRDRPLPADYVQKQPFGEIPVLDHNGFLLYESRAIGRYIAETFAHQGPQLIPTEPKAKALFEQAAAVEFANYDALAFTAIKEVVLKPRHGIEPDMEQYRRLYKQLETKLDVYDSILSKQKYLAGEEITLADLFHIPVGATLMTITPDVFSEKRPNVFRWWNDIWARPSWQAIKDGIKSTA